MVDFVLLTVILLKHCPDAINEHIDIGHDYIAWLHFLEQPDRFVAGQDCVFASTHNSDSSLLFSCCNYKFVLEPATKVQILNLENQISHRQNAAPHDIIQVHNKVFLSFHKILFSPKYSPVL